MPAAFSQILTFSNRTNRAKVIKGGAISDDIERNSHDIRDKKINTKRLLYTKDISKGRSPKVS